MTQRRPSDSWLPCSTAPGRGDHDEPQVEVHVFAERVAVVDPVEVEVDRGNQDAQAVDAGLLGRLPERHPGELGVAVGVSAGLEPTPQLGVEQDEDALARRVDDQRGSGEMSRCRGAIGQCRPVSLQQVEDPTSVAVLVGREHGVEQPRSGPDRGHGSVAEPRIAVGEDLHGQRADRHDRPAGRRPATRTGRLRPANRHGWSIATEMPIRVEIDGGPAVARRHVGAGRCLPDRSGRSPGHPW